jgi:transposase
VFQNESFESHNGKDVVIVDVVPRKNGRAICSGCHQPGTVYDHQPQARYFEFIPVWGFLVFFKYVMRRVNCKSCGVKVELVPWGDGKHQLTYAYRIFLARWAKRLSWQEVAEAFSTTWDQVYSAVAYVVDFGLKHRDLNGITSIGVDEIQFGKGHDYLTVVYQIDQGQKRLLSVVQKRTVKSFLRALREIDQANFASIRYVCSDMWKPYLKVIQKKLPQAVHVLDRFHIVKKLNEAVDDVRREETKKLNAQGYENVLKDSRYCFLKNQENLTDQQVVKLGDLMQYDLKSVRAYLLKESF